MWSVYCGENEFLKRFCKNDILKIMSNFSLMVGFAMRDLFKSRVMFTLVIASIAVATTAIIAINSILLGFSSMLTEGNRGWMGDIVITSPDDSEPSIEQMSAMEEQLLSQNHIQSVAPRSYSASSIKMVGGERWIQPYRVIGVDIQKERGVTTLRDKVVEGDFLRANGPVDQAVVGLLVADFLVGAPYDGIRAHAGDEITVRAGSGETKQYTISGVIDAKTFLPNLLLYVLKDEAENVLGAQKNSEVVVLLDDPLQSITVRDQLAVLFPKLTVHTSEEEAGFVQDILNTVSFISSSINQLLVFSVFLVINIVMYISVMQRRRQIGIMKSLGASSLFVVGAYLVESFSYAFIAYAFGSIFYTILYAYSLINPIPLLIGDFQMILNSAQMIASLTLVIFAATAGGVIPSWIAARTLIIDVLNNKV
jgi:putative ABC transport system permease protein